MPGLFRIIFIAVFNLSCLSSSIAQDLLNIPPVINAMVNKDSTLSFVITTCDYSRFTNTPELKPYVNSLQIFDADMAWPPRWYTATPVYTDEMYRSDSAQNMYRLDVLVDAKVESRYFSFYKLLSHQSQGVSFLVAPDIAGYILLNQKMESIDTVKSNLKRRNLFYHDFRINNKGERLVDLRKESFMDLRDYTNDQKDSTVHCNIDYIQVLDSNNNILYSWNPLEHVDPALFHYKEILADHGALGSNNSQLVEWTRLTSAIWDYDGNILYCMRRIGLGKFSRTDGHVMWHLDMENMPLVVGKDTLEWYSPHDLNFLYDDDSTATYSVYSDGKEGFNAGAVIFKINKRTSKFSLVKKINPSRPFVSKGQGNLDYKKNGEFVISYGNRLEPDPETDFREDIEYGKNGKVTGLYKTAKRNSVFKAHKLDNWPRPPRPVISIVGDKLEAFGNMTGDWIWYKLSGTDNTTISLVGKGKTIVPDDNTTYCVEAKYGIGNSVSRPFLFKQSNKKVKNEPY